MRFERELCQDRHRLCRSLSVSGRPLRPLFAHRFKIWEHEHWEWLYEASSFRNCTFHWTRKSQTWQIGVQTSKPLWHGPDLMNSWISWMSHRDSHMYPCFVLFYLQKPSNLHKAQGFSAHHGLCCSQEAWQAITGVTCFGCQPQFLSWATWPFWPMWKIARVTEISMWGPVPKDLAVQDMDHCPKLFQCSISLFFFLVVDLNLYVSLCLLSIFTASSRFGSSGCWIDFPGDEGDQARKNRSRLLRKLWISSEGMIDPLTLAGLTVGKLPGPVGAAPAATRLTFFGLPKDRIKVRGCAKAG